MKKKINKILHIIVLSCCIISAFVVPSLAVSVENSEYFPVYSLMPISTISFNGSSGNVYMYEGLTNVVTAFEFNDTTSKLYSDAIIKPNLNGAGANNIPLFGWSETKRMSLSNQVYLASGNLVLQKPRANSEKYSTNYYGEYGDAMFKDFTVSYEPFVYSKNYNGTSNNRTKFVLYTKVADRFNSAFDRLTKPSNGQVYVRYTQKYYYQYVNAQGVLKRHYNINTNYVSIGGRNTTGLNEITFYPLDYSSDHFTYGIDYLIEDLTFSIDFDFYTKIDGQYVRLESENHKPAIPYWGDVLYNISYNNLCTRLGDYNNVQYFKPSRKVQLFMNSIKQDITINEFQGDYVKWISTAIGGFMDSEIFPNFTIGGMLGVIIAIPVAIWFLKLFAGG